MKIVVRRKMKSLKEVLEENQVCEAKVADCLSFPDAPKTKVKNVPNSSDYKEPSGISCIGYWEEQTGYVIKEEDVYYCPACGKKMSKSTSNLDGAHVFKLSKPNDWYFTPLCSECNNHNNEDVMEVASRLVPVPPECYQKKE